MTGRMRRDSRPLGSQLTITSNSEAVLDALEGTLGAYPETLAIGGSLVIDVQVVPDREGDPGWPAVGAEFDAGVMTVRCGSSYAVVHQHEGSAQIVLAESLASITDAVRLFAEAAFTSVHVAQGRLHAVHSALVAHEGVGLLLRGPSGAGKSTLTYACLRRGMSVVSDDWVYAAAGRRPHSLAGYPWRMMLTQEAAQRFPELAGIELVPHTSAEGWKMPIVPPLDRRHPEHRVDAVVLLDASPTLSLQPIDAEEARRRFWDASLPIERDNLPNDFVDGLLDRPTYVLHRGTSPDDAAQLLQELATRCPTSS
jgi:hypothetical protein